MNYFILGHLSCIFTQHEFYILLHFLIQCKHDFDEKDASIAEEPGDDRKCL